MRTTTFNRIILALVVLSLLLALAFMLYELPLSRQRGVEIILSLPYTILLISPTIFVALFGCLAGCACALEWLERRTGWGWLRRLTTVYDE